MSYREYWPELRTATLFQNIGEDALIELLDVMRPEIVYRKADEKSGVPIDLDKGLFCVILRGKSLDRLADRPDVYDMPKYGEPGMIMGEIPALSEMKKSRAPKMRPRGGGHGVHDEEFDLCMLRMSGEMVTRYYGERYARAQSVLLRNFLGILAQKVTDIRKEKSELAALYEAELAPYRLNVFCAGVSRKMTEAAAEKWNALCPELPVTVTVGGSVDLVRYCVAGDPCDLLISADDAIIRGMMMPNYTDGYRVWAGNRMVVTGNGITSENWEEKLLAKEATFKHNNPYEDPGGYRAVMALLLADQYKHGLSERLMNHPGHIGMEKNPGPFGNMKPAQYSFSYYSSVKPSGSGGFALLPEVMDLSNPALADVYAKVSFAVDDNNIVTATPIAHALTIPKTALHRKSAQRFAELFLAIDKEAEGFLPRDGVVGADPMK